MPHQWTTNQRNYRFEVSSFLILCNNNESYLDWFVTCDTKWILYIWRRSAQWSDWDAPKHFPKPNLCQKKVMITVWWSAACLIYYGFLNPGKTIPSEKYAQQIDEMHLKLQCLKPALLNRKNPNSSPWQHSTTHDTTTASKAEWIALRSSASFSTFSWPLANWLPLLQASQGFFPGKMHSKSQSNPETQIFMLQE